MTAAEPRFDIDLAYGQQGELLVASIVDSLRDGTGAIEVKSDRRWRDTGNVYVELECRRRGRYVASGLQTTTATLWAFVIGYPAVVLIVPTAMLHEEVWRAGTRRAEETDGSHPTRGALVSTTVLMARLRSHVRRGR